MYDRSTSLGSCRLCKLSAGHLVPNVGLEQTLAPREPHFDSCFFVFIA